jgi:hypothetical protein
MDFVLLGVDGSLADRRQRGGDASSPNPGDSIVVSGHRPFGAAIDGRMSMPPRVGSDFAS